MKQEFQEKMWQRDDFNKEEDRKIEYAKIEQKREEAVMKEEVSLVRENMKMVDSDGNGIADEIDLRRTEVDETYKQDSIALGQAKLEETKRSNMANEEIKRQKPVKVVAGGKK